MFTNNRLAYRNAFYTAWQKYLANEQLAPQEADIVQVIVLHPEYQNLLIKHSDQNEYELEENPFLHMGLHITIHEQIRLDRPLGIKKIYAALLEKETDTHQVEHQMMTCLGQVVWQAQQTGETPAEDVYLQLLSQLYP